MVQFYEYRYFLYARYDTNGLIEQANNLYNYLNNLDLEGIQINVPYKENMDRLLNDPLTNKYEPALPHNQYSCFYTFSFRQRYADIQNERGRGKGSS